MEDKEEMEGIIRNKKVKTMMMMMMKMKMEMKRANVKLLLRKTKA